MLWARMLAYIRRHHLPQLRHRSEPRKCRSGTERSRPGTTNCRLGDVCKNAGAWGSADPRPGANN
jgi:hypothetical protein